MIHGQKVVTVAMLVIAPVIAFGIAFGLGFSAGVKLEGREQREVAATRARVERQIVDLIVERNSQATIREFAGFPEHLIAESEKHHVDFRLVLALIDHESAFDPRAVGSRGEIGLMQVMPSTAESVARKLGDAISMELPTRAKGGGYASLGTLGDPKANVTIGLAYLAELRDAFGEMSATTLRAYNRGPSRARERRPDDRYAEAVSLQFVRVAHELAATRP